MMTGALDYRRAALGAAVFSAIVVPRAGMAPPHIVVVVVHVALYYYISYEWHAKQYDDNFVVLVPRSSVG